ncbi:hypothetical protein B0H10DRAFT_2218373 [Mycena sp. CBHHK59/15]|nr:hypothetical protein B0H10DRAFT_2218373 [Mycena sp. CBHHK59/15]
MEDENSAVNNVDPISPGPSSSNDFDPKGEELDPSDEDLAVAKPSRKRTSAKGAMRKAIDDACNAQHKNLIASGTTADAKTKRKASTSKQSGRSASTKEVQSYSNISQRSRSAGSVMSIDAQSNVDQLPPVSDYQDSSEGYVGVDSNNHNNNEKQWAKEHDQPDL